MSLTSWLKKKVGIDTINSLVTATSNKINVLQNLVNSLSSKVNNLNNTTEVTKTEYYLDPEVKNSINNLNLDITNLTTDLKTISELISAIQKDIETLNGEFTGFRNNNYLVGSIDDSNNIYVHTDNLESGTYCIKYLGKDGKPLSMYDTIVKFTI